MPLVFALNCLIVSLVVVTHYEFLGWLGRLLKILRLRHRTRILVGVFWALIAHALEVWIFAVAYYWMSHTDGWGSLTGATEGTLLDCAYFSFTVFTTLGFGDIGPVGNLRYLTGLEALSGMVLITWTASFLFMEMQRHWENRH